MSMLDYAQLAALAAVVREGSFERAAQALHVTPSAVSQRIKALEERVGARLVVRGQPCTATAAGRQLCRHAEQVALLEHELHAALPALGGGDERGGAPTSVPTLRIAVNADSLATWVVPALARLAAAEPVLFDLVIDDQDHTAEALRSGEVLAAVSGESAPLPGGRCVPLGRLRYRACASPAFVERLFSDGVNAATLARAPCLRFNAKDALQAQWVRRQCRREVSVPCHAMASTHGFVDATALGLGWGLSPEALLAAHLADGRVVEVVPGRPLDVPLFWHTPRLAMPLLQRLGEALQAAARDALRR